MPSFKIAGATLALLSFVPSVLCDCESFGVDFQSGNTYFQNVNSNESFTALQEFQDCQDDSAHNVFVNPDGDQTECSETPMTPDNTPQLVTCQDYPKNKLYTGDWSLLVISNNGDADPIAYQRDFSLTVGEQETTTITPTVTVNVNETPVANITSTETSTVTDEADPSTISNGNQGTQTVTPKPTTRTITRALVTLTQRTQTYEVEASTKTVPASCSVQPTRRFPDPVATILPSVLGQLDNIVQDVVNLNKEIVGDAFGLIGLNKIIHFKKRDLSASAKFKREILAGRSPSEEVKRDFVRERRSMLEARSLERRAPDNATVTFTDTANIVTSTVSDNVPTTTQTVTETDLVTVTTTPPPVTAGAATVTASGVTRTRTIRVPIVNVTKTQTKTTTIVNTSTTTSEGAASACASQGGQLV